MIKGHSLNLHDRNAMLIVSVVVALLLLASGMVAAGMALRRLDQTIATRSQALRTIGQLRSEAQVLQGQLREREEQLTRTEGVSLVIVAEGLANRIAGQGNLAYLRPLAASAQNGLQVETMELKLERQSLEQALRLLWEVENSPAAPMRIISLRLQRRFENHALLDITMTVNAYRK